MAPVSSVQLLPSLPRLWWQYERLSYEKIEFSEMTSDCANASLHFCSFSWKKLFYTHFQLSMPTSFVLSSYIHTPSENFWSFLHRAFITAWPGESPKPNSAGTDRAATHGGFYYTGSMTRWHNRRKWGTPQPQAIWLFVETGETLEELLWVWKFLYYIYSPPWMREKAGTEGGYMDKVEAVLLLFFLSTLSASTSMEYNIWCGISRRQIT